MRKYIGRLDSEIFQNPLVEDRSKEYDTSVRVVNDWNSGLG